MTREEAIYCMKSYIDNPNYEHCTSCPYYGTNQIGENVFVCNSSEAHKMAIETLEQEPRWIPVSERLPKPYTWVYATCKSLVDDRENWVIDTCYVPLPKEYNSRYSDWGNIPMLNWGQAEVIAWMEWIIPEPYKASPTGAESEVQDADSD